MSSKKISALFGALSMVALIGCNTVPSKPDFSITIPGDYKSVSDCAFMKFRDMGGWTKTDYDSMQKTEFTFGSDVAVAGRIEIVQTGDMTTVTSYFPSAIWGKDTWPNQHRPIFQACSS